MWSNEGVKLDQWRVNGRVSVGIFDARRKLQTSNFKHSRFQKEYRGNKELVHIKTSQIVTLFALAIIILASPLSLHAEITNGTTNQTTLSHPAPAPSVSLGFLASLSRSRSLIDHQDGTLQESMDILLNPTAVWGKTSLSIKGAFSQDLRRSENSDWTDTSFSLGRELNRWRNERMAERTFSMSLLGSLPTSKISSVKQSLMGSLGVGTSIAFLPKRADYGISLSLGLSASKYFHRFDTAGDGSVNNTAGSNQSLAVGIQMGDFSISGKFIHKTRWTYQGSNKNAFEHSEEFGYLITPNIQVAIGHTNAGAVQKLSGDTNVQLIDENESLIYSSLTMSY